MKSMAIQVMLLVLILAAGNSVCAMNCSAQPCHRVPPCHQQHGALVCDHALPVADVAVVHVVAPELVAVAAVSSTPRLERCWVGLVSEAPTVTSKELRAYTILRI